MHMVKAVTTLGFFIVLTSLVLPSNLVFAQTPCCPCGGPCPMYNSRHQLTCVCCTCGAMVQIMSYDAKTRQGKLRFMLPLSKEVQQNEEQHKKTKNLHHSDVEELQDLTLVDFTVAESGVNDELIKKALKDTGTKLQLSLKFSGEIKDGLLNQKVECVGVNEHFPDRTGAIILSREAWSLYETPPTHEPDRPMQHDSADRHK